MPKRTRDHHAWLISELKNPVTASNYLNEALADSPQMFLKALRNVGEAFGISIVAKEAGFRRETLYKSLSKHGNPRLKTLDAVLQALRLDIWVKPKKAIESGLDLQAQGAARRRIIVSPHRSRSRMVNPNQLALDFARDLASKSTAEAVQSFKIVYTFEQPDFASARVRSTSATATFSSMIGVEREPFAQMSSSPFDELNLALLVTSQSAKDSTSRRLYEF